MRPGQTYWFLYHALQPIRIQERHCIFVGSTPNLPIVRSTYVALILFTTVFSKAWYKLVMQCFLVVYRILLKTASLDNAIREFSLA